MSRPPTSSPLWLCSFREQPSTYVAAPRPRGAEVQCRDAGLGTPTSVQYAGYTAAPGSEAEQQPKPPKRQISSRRAELALTLYALLRVDWPIGSILAPAKAAARLPSQSALRDFLADTGTAIARLEADTDALDAVVIAQGKTWFHANREKNSRLAGDWKEAERHQERKELYRSSARRLRKRRAYQLAIGELMASLEGILPSSLTVSETFAAFLLASGMAADDVQSLTRRLRRISVPRL